jgi:hypothetical protein
VTWNLHWRRIIRLDRLRSRTQNTTQKSISFVFCVSSIRHDSSLSKYRKQKQSPPLEIFKMAHIQGGDCFCLRYLPSDESWRIALTQKTKEMDFCVVFCVEDVLQRRHENGVLSLCMKMACCHYVWKWRVVTMYGISLLPTQLFGKNLNIKKILKIGKNVNIIGLQWSLTLNSLLFIILCQFLPKSCLRRRLCMDMPCHFHIVFDVRILDLNPSWRRIDVVLKVHTDRTRFGNATRIFNFQWHLTSIFFYVFQIFGTT